MRIFGVLILMVLFSSCGTQERDAHTLRSNLYEYPRFFDPRKGGDPVSFTMGYMLYEGLARLGVDGKLELTQAEKIELSEDKKTYTFYLGDHLWSNGEPVTAHDFAGSWLSMLDPNFPSISTHLLYPIKNAREAKRGNVALEEVGIRVINDKTLQVELEYPTPYFPELVAHCSLYPINLEHEKIVPDWDHRDGKDYVCNGPFRLAKAAQNEEVVLVRNPQYRGKHKAKLRKVIFSILPDDMSAFNLFASGDLDVIGMPLTRIPLPYFKTLKEREVLEAAPIAGNLFVGFNTNAFPFNNVNIRKAFSYAIERQAIVDHVAQLDEEVATHAIPSILRSGVNIEYFKDGDGATAREYFQKGLQELQLKESEFPSITLLCFPYEITQIVAATVQDQWKKVLKVEVKAEMIPYVNVLDRVYKEEYKVAVFGWFADFYDPMSWFNRYASKDDPKNYARWQCTPEFADLLAEARKEEDLEKRQEILRKAEAVFMDQMPIAPILHWKFPYLVRPYVKDYGISPLGQIYFSDVSIDPKAE